MTAETPSVEGPEAERSRSALMQTLLDYASLSNMLRLLGAGVLMTSVSVFLFKGWSTGNDVERYLMLLTHTLLLAGTGLVIGRWVKESKGARLFLGLAQIFAMVNFAVLGAIDDLLPGLGELVLPAAVPRSLGLPQDRDDLLLAESTLPHRLLLFSFEENCHFKRESFRGSGHPHNRIRL